MFKYALLFGIGAITVMGCVVNSVTNRQATFNEKPAEQQRWLTPALLALQNQPQKLAEHLDSNTVCLQNEGAALPLNNLQTRTSVITLGGNSDAFVEGLKLFFQPSVAYIYAEQAVEEVEKIKTVERCIVSVHAAGPNSTELSDWSLKSLAKIPKGKEMILVIFGNVQKLKTEHLERFDAVLWVPENHPEAQNRCAQKLVGALPLVGRLDKKMLDFEAGDGIYVASNGRLSFETPEALGMDSKRFEKIDQMALSGISAGAYPGCQIVVAVKGKVIYRKSFGSYTYDKASSKVSDNSLYDIASITKIAASTLTAMKLHSDGKLNLDERLGNYIPEVTGETGYKSIVIREMMAHQAGLEPFIPFYKRTLTDGKPTLPWYATQRDEVFGLEVADQLYMKSSYKDSMYARILRNPLKEKKYVYSDLCYYFMQPIIEKLTGQPLDAYVRSTFYQAMGLPYIGYKPLTHFAKEQIVPTENENYFRKQLLWGHVHDPGAAMLGGVAGHAGLFSNATDLASIMQLFLNKGNYAGQTFFNEATVKEFTKAQFSGNKRGIGFDRPSAKGGGTCDELASQQSFGHSGFTGTLAWADPKNEVVFVFLSNRVHPSQDNWKIRDMNIRTNIQHVVYEIVNERFKN
jgi:CubicO group peptidase (beta-lactamase class C family)